MPNLSRSDWSKRRQERTTRAGLWVALGVFFAGQGLFHGLLLLTFFSHLHVHLISSAEGFLMIGASAVLLLAGPFGAVAAHRAYRGDRAVTTALTAGVLFFVGQSASVAWRWLNVLDAARSVPSAGVLAVPVLHLLFALVILVFLVRTRTRMPDRLSRPDPAAEVKAGA